MGNNITKAVDYPVSFDTLDSLHQTFIDFCIGLQVILIVTGGCGNILTLIAIALHKKLHKSYNIYIAHLASVDIVISLLMIPIDVVGLFGTKWSTHVCEIISVISLCCLVVSIMTLMMIAVNRFVLICKERQIYGRLFNQKKVVISIVAMWIWALAVTLPLKAINGLGWSEKTHYCFFKNYQFDVYLYINICFANLGVVVPAVVASICYVSIIKKLRKMTRKLQPNDLHQSTTQPDAKNTAIYDNVNDVSSIAVQQPIIEDAVSNSGNAGLTLAQAKQKKLDKKKKAHNRRVLGLIAIFSLFILCWMPLALTFMIDYRQQLPAWVYVSLMSVAYINSTVNVYLYAYTNRSFHHAFLCILKLKFSEINNIIK